MQDPLVLKEMLVVRVLKVPKDIRVKQVLQQD